MVIRSGDSKRVGRLFGMFEVSLMLVGRDRHYVNSRGKWDR